MCRLDFFYMCDSTVLTAPSTGSGHSHHSRSSSTSSISSTVLSQDSTHQPHPQAPPPMPVHSLTNSGLGYHAPSSSATPAAASAFESSTAAPALCGGSSSSTASAQAHSQGRQSRVAYRTFSGGEVLRVYDTVHPSREKS